MQAYIEGWWWEKDYSACCALPFGPRDARCLAVLDPNLQSTLLTLLRCNFREKLSDK